MELISVNSMALFFGLIVAHFIFDFSLQNDFIPKAKNHTTDLGSLYWKWVLPAHSFMHGGAVYFITGSLVLGLIETIAHCIIDHLKCDNKITFNQDQWLHIGFKLMYTYLIVYEVPFVMYG